MVPSTYRRIIIIFSLLGHDDVIKWKLFRIMDQMKCSQRIVVVVRRLWSLTSPPPPPPQMLYTSSPPLCISVTSHERHNVLHGRQIDCLFTIIGQHHWDCEENLLVTDWFTHKLASACRSKSTLASMSALALPSPTESSLRATSKGQ